MTSEVDRGAMLRVALGPLRLKNPVLVASGTYGYGEEYADIYDPSLLGGIVTKGISMRPRSGNLPPRIAETPAGMLNAIGLENPGIEEFLVTKVPIFERIDTALIVNIFGESLDEYAQLAERLDDVASIDGVELNISCPNVECGGLEFGQEPSSVESVVSLVRKRTKKPLLVKLSPNVTDVSVIARAAEAGGADVLCLINTLRGMAIDVRTRRPRLRNVSGGLSGPAIRPVAVYQVHATKKAVSLPLIGIGGIQTVEDAVELILAGASAVQVGTANFRDPAAATNIITGLPAFLEDYGMSTMGEMVGAAIPFD